MRTELKFAISIAFFIIINFGISNTDSAAQSLPPICTLNGSWLSGPEFLNNTSMTDLDIRNFLAAHNSWLRGDEEQGSPHEGMVLDTDGTTWFDFAQAVIDAAAYPNGGDPGPISPKPINPQLLLAMVQKESSMITARQRPSQIDDPSLTLLTGCGNPSNMREQLQCAARTLRNRFDQLAKCQNVSEPPWNLNLETPTQDGITLKPWNASIGANYVYNPVAGILFGGQTTKGGVALFCFLWNSAENEGGFGFASAPATPKLGPVNPTLTCTDPLTPVDRRDVIFSISGGAPPYNWEAKNSQGVNTGTIVACGPNQEDAVLKPPVNNGGFPGIMAYAQGGIYKNCANTVNVCTGGQLTQGCAASVTAAGFGCSDQYINTYHFSYACGTTWSMNATYQTCSDPMGAVRVVRGTCSMNLNNCNGKNYQQICSGTGSELFTDRKDWRTQAMKNANCNPCLLMMQGATVTVKEGSNPVASVSVTIK